MTGSSTQGIKTVLHPVSDLATAKAVYAALLGVPPQTDGSYYVGFEAEGQHIGLVPGGGPQGMTSPVAYWHVPDGEALLVATPTDSPTGRNLAATRAVRLGLGHTRDVSMIEGEVEVLEIDALPQQRGDRFVARTGFDPRALVTPYRWFRISPRRIQAS